MIKDSDEKQVSPPGCLGCAEIPSFHSADCSLLAHCQPPRPAWHGAHGDGHVGDQVDDQVDGRLGQPGGRAGQVASTIPLPPGF